MRDRALLELGLHSISRSEALRELNRLCIEEDHTAELNAFYLLHYAWDDLLRSDVQWYWPGATRENIAEFARAELEKFVEAARLKGLVDHV